MKWILIYQRNVDGALQEYTGFDMKELARLERLVKGRFEYDKEVFKVDRLGNVL